MLSEGAGSQTQTDKQAATLLDCVLCKLQTSPTAATPTAAEYDPISAFYAVIRIALFAFYCRSLEHYKSNNTKIIFYVRKVVFIKEYWYDIKITFCFVQYRLIVNR